jgi:hypothetical protein
MSIEGIYKFLQKQILKERESFSAGYFIQLKIVVKRMKDI